MEHSVLSLLATRVAEAVPRAFGPDTPVPDALVQPTRDPRHGDYQSPVAMALARSLRRPPLELAAELAEALDLDDVCEAPEVAPPGFVNLRLRPSWLAGAVAGRLGDERLGVGRVEPRQRVVLDYSAPNMAKEMHVGHLRSTIIGDALANVLEFQGHEVERVSHVGDYGTQFGMLVAHLETEHPDALEHTEGVDLGDMGAFYQAAKRHFDADSDFADRARTRVVDLQSGEPTARRAWQVLLDATRRENAGIYRTLGVEGLIERGESAYEPMLADVVSDLEAKGLLTVDAGARCVFPPGFSNKEGEPLPVIVQKRDGGYNYDTTDLAALRSRVESGADRIIYVVDNGQSMHFDMLFAVARMAGWLPESVEAVHVSFGLVLGEGGKRLRTRAGDTVRLRDLLDEAVDRARAFLEERAAERGQPLPDDVERVAEVVGIGAVKYADLAQNRQSNYVFSFDKMLTLKGNTAPYLQYAYVRMRSILREAGWADGPPSGAAVQLDTEQELVLARQLVQLGDVVDRVGEEYAPNHLCAYLYELSQAFNQFYEHCPVLRADEPVRTSRLALCEATSATLRLGLGVLGIEVLERI